MGFYSACFLMDDPFFKKAGISELIETKIDILSAIFLNLIVKLSIS